MATSGVYDMAVSGTEMFTDILQFLEVYGVGRTPKPEDFNVVKRCFNRWLLLQNGPENPHRTGSMIWLRESATLTLSTSSADYDLRPSGGDLAIQIPYHILNIVYRDSYGNDTPIAPMTKREYDEISDKDASGQPQRYYYEKRLDTGKLYFDYVPSSADSAIITYKQKIELIDDYTNTFDLDPSWYELAIYRVAIRVGPFFGLTLEHPKMKTAIVLGKESAEIVDSMFPDNEPTQMRPA